MSIDAQRKKLDADMEMLGARITGLSEGVEGLESDVSSLADSILTLTRHSAQLAEAIGPVIIAARKAGSPTAPAVSSTEGPEATNRHVWVVEVPAHDEYGVGPISVMIEQFGDRAPTIAFRRAQSDVWGRPYRGQEA